MFSSQALMILVFLVPGFLSMAFLDMLTPARKRDDLQKIVNALIFSLIIYGIYSLAFDDYPLMMIEKTVNSEKHYELDVVRKSMPLILAISIALPIVLAFLQKHDLHMKLFRKIKVTDRTSRSKVWFDVFTDIKRYVIINFEDGRRLFGWPEYYCDDPEDQTLFLCQAAWIQESGELTPLENRGILITPNERIDTIEFCMMEGE